ncbi:hypothetical protein CTEN210_04104 [Chaetoceros tenuissimus]|uniref:Transcriptional adapter n=1 Tax=Chaetoceros tenuissimus TaxID=426638 RepID=A0AAD3H2M4_9STRA|nr:hypothetical protein CTEN210_04104 [Chaetoceros tenuissimus]
MAPRKKKAKRSTPSPICQPTNTQTPLNLILTSSKKRGLYECDYCRTDLSQVPRICCAICPEFDLCLDCFTKKPDKCQTIEGHEDSHGYRVCDSTRFFLFPSLRGVKLVQEEQEDVEKQVEKDGENEQEKESEKQEAPENEKKAPERSESDISQQKHPHTSGAYIVTDDVKNMWTVEEDLRLLEAIGHLGLGNWMDIAEEVAGPSGTIVKNPKKCMERYLYDYLGRYGHILPQYTLVEHADEEQEDTVEEEEQNGQDQEQVGEKRKRPSISRRSSFTSVHTDKEYIIVPTEELEGYQEIWPKPYLPPLDVNIGDDVGRDLAVKAEATYVKTLAATSSTKEAQELQKEWQEKYLNTHGGPTVLPPRPDDVAVMPGSDLAGYMPRRGDFDIEWDNDAEKLLQDMEFTQGDTPEERARKIKVLAIYNARLDVREERKQFIKDRGLLDYRKKFQEDNKLPSDERDLKNRMRLFARFQTPQEHDELVQNLLQAKRLRKEIARLQMYRRMGFTSLADAEKFELDRNRREFHRVACENREKEERKAAAMANELGMNGALSSSELNGSYLKHSKSKRNSFEPVLGETATGNTDTVGQNGTAPGTVDASSSSVENGVSNFDVKKCPGHELLTKKELDLCQKLQCQPQLYTKAKSALIQEALKQDMLDDENARTKTLFKIDIEKKDDVIKFIASSGWIPELPKSRKAVS